MNDSTHRKYREYCIRIIFTILLPVFILGFILLIFASVMYDIMPNDGDGDGDIRKTKMYLFGYIISQGIYTFITFYYICIGICSYCYYCCNSGKQLSMEKIYFSLPLAIIAIIVIVTYAISCIFVGFVTYDFFTCNYTTSYEYFVPMLIFIILLLIEYGIPLLCFVIILVLSVCVIWPLSICYFCIRKNRYSQLE